MYFCWFGVYISLVFTLEFSMTQVCYIKMARCSVITLCSPLQMPPNAYCLNWLQMQVHAKKTTLTQIDACRCFELLFACPILKVCPILNWCIRDKNYFLQQKGPYFGIIALVRFRGSDPDLQFRTFEWSKVRSNHFLSYVHTAKLRILWFLVPSNRLVFALFYNGVNTISVKSLYYLC